MKIAIVGSRTFSNYGLMRDYIEKICYENNYIVDTIISGGAKGADSLAEKLANEFGIELLVFPAQWDKYGKRAGYMRNVEIIKNCDVCFAFWDGISKGTKMDIDLCKQYNILVFVCNFEKK